MTIGKKITFSSGAGLVVTLLLGLVALYGLSSLGDRVRLVVEESLYATYWLAEARASHGHTVRRGLLHLVTESPEEMAAIEPTILEARQRFQRALIEYRKKLLDPTEGEMAARLQVLHDRYLLNRDKVQSLSRQMKTAEALRVYQTEARPAALEVDTLIDEVISYNKKKADAYGAEAVRTLTAVRWTILGLLIGALVGGVLLIGNVVRGVNRLLSAIREGAAELSGSSQEVASAASEFAASGQELAQGASEQAASVTQTGATLEEIRATSAQTMEKAKALGQAAERTRQESARGLDAIRQTVAAMEAVRAKVQAIAETILALSAQTHQVGEITGMVGGLAQQSKMLALNASIEAAKAGDAGKGFAVVAAEVRDLAEQSQQATAQVQKILQEIRHATDKAVMATEEGAKEADAGVGLVQQTGELVRSLSEVIDESSVASQQIVGAVRQESAGIDQISVAMHEISKATQQFVSATRQTSQSAQDLGRVAGRLRERVGSLAGVTGDAAVGA